MDQRAVRLARGEPEAFAELYDTCADRIYRYLVVRLGSRADAEDVLQETKENANEAPEKDHQMDRDRRGSRDHYPAAPECLFRLEHRNTA